MRYKAAWLFEQGLPCGAEANMAKLLAAEASWAAANACLDTHGGFGFAEEYDVERKFRETRLYKVAPVSNNLDPRLPRPARARHAPLATDVRHSWFSPHGPLLPCFVHRSTSQPTPSRPVTPRPPAASVLMH